MIIKVSAVKQMLKGSGKRSNLATIMAIDRKVTLMIQEIIAKHNYKNTLKAEDIV